MELQFKHDTNLILPDHNFRALQPLLIYIILTKLAQM